MQNYIKTIFNNSDLIWYPVDISHVLKDFKFYQVPPISTQKRPEIQTRNIYICL